MAITFGRTVAMVVLAGALGALGACGSTNDHATTGITASSSSGSSSTGSSGAGGTGGIGGSCIELGDPCDITSVQKCCGETNVCPVSLNTCCVGFGHTPPHPNDCCDAAVDAAGKCCKKDNTFTCGSKDECCDPL